MPRVEKKHWQIQVETNTSEQKIFFRINGNLPTELCHRVVSCVLNMGDLIANNLCKFSK